MTTDSSPATPPARAAPPQLLAAVARGDLEQVKEVVAVHVHDRAVLHQALVNAAKYNRLDIVRFLVGDPCQCDVNAAVEPKTQRSVLAVAVNMGHVETAHALVHELGACVDHQDRQGLTPLMLCCASGRRALVELLVRAGADVARRAHNGLSALDMCATPGLRDLLTAAATLPYYELAELPAFSSSSSSSLLLPCLQFPANRGRCVRFGHIVAAGAAPVDVAVKCSSRRADVERELAVLKALPGGGPFVRPLCADVLTFRPASAEGDPALRWWYGIALEQGACDVQHLGVALAEARHGAGAGAGPWALRRHLARQCCAAVHALHAAGLVWCDAKPANFVVFAASTCTSTGGRHESPAQLAARLRGLPDAALGAAVAVKAIDLGGCRPAGAQVPADQLAFTVKFAAPELARAARGAATVSLEASADAWSVGALLLQMAHPAFEPFLSLAPADPPHGKKASALQSLGRLDTADLAALQADIDACVDAAAQAAAADDDPDGTDGAAPLLHAARTLLRVEPTARASLQAVLDSFLT